jgi:hypothetical protein
MWSRQKSMSAWLYTEQEVINMIEERFPGKNRGKCSRRRKPYPAKQ